MNRLRSLLVAVGFLTRLPLYAGDQVEEKDLGRSIAWFPLVGAALGAILWVVDQVVRGHLPWTVEAVVLVALLVWLSGGLHLDGLADVFDGLSGGRGDRTRTLEIMRDSRIGAHGAAALLLALLLKAAALAELLNRGDSWLLVTFPAMSRLALTVLIFAFPYVRPEGLGSAFKRHGRPEYLTVAVVTAGVVLGLAGPAAFGPAAAALVVALVFSAWLWRRLGGLTGDVYGAAAELAELAFLVVACLR